MLRDADLETLDRSQPLTLGDLLVDPASRELSGPAGRIAVEPRVMRLLLLLHEYAGSVVTREQMAQHIWQGRFVADDTINNAVAELRRALKASAASGLKVETIPKAGYRLIVDAPRPHPVPEPERQEAPTRAPLLSRRLAIGGGLAAGATVLAAWQLGRPADREVALLVEEGVQALRTGLPESGKRAANALEQAVRRDPGNPRALGLLALARRAAAEYAPPDQVADLLAAAELAARQALTVDSRQSDALTALATLSPSFGRWIEAERSIRQVLAVDGRNPFAVGALATLLMSTGQVRACLERLQWLHRTTPLSANVQFRRVYTLWSAGRTPEMDRVADLALQMWPSHSGVWFARMWTFAFTGRAANALAMAEDPAGRPPMPAPALALLEASLTALRSGAPEDVQRAVAGNLAAASRGPSQSIAAIMVLSALGSAPAALDVATSFLARRGTLVIRGRHSPAQASLPDQHHRMAMMLWVPASANMREQPGFRALCESIGLLHYWQSTNTRPDRGGTALPV
nr:winged helix-turn-helix domain-containing protein [uncultured Sphingomonas sp.]